MKIIATIILIAFSAISMFAQSDSYKTIAKNIENNYKTLTISFNKETFPLLGHLDIALRDELSSLANNIDNMKVIVNSSDTQNDFCADWTRLLESNGYKKYSILRYSNMRDVTIYVTSRLFTILEAHFVTPHNDGFVVSFFGHFSRRDLRRLMRSAQNIPYTPVQ